MARRAGRQCAVAHCAGIAMVGRYCARHSSVEDRPSVVEERESVPAARPSPSARGYDRRWQRIRRRILATSPLCVHCRADGRVTLATEVDHITPLRAGGTHTDDNLQPLCKSCHSRKTNQDMQQAPGENRGAERGGAV